MQNNASLLTFGFPNDWEVFNHISPVVFPYFRGTLRYVACFSQIIFNIAVVFFSAILFLVWTKSLRTNHNSSLLLRYRKLPFVLYFTAFVLWVQNSIPPKTVPLKVLSKNHSELFLVLDCICSLYVLIYALICTFELILFCQRISVLLSCSGMVTVVLDLLLWQPLFFCKRTFSISLNCSSTSHLHSFLVKNNHRSQRNGSVLARNCETKFFKQLSKPCSSTFVCELKFADGKCCGVAGTEPQERWVPPAELKDSTGGEGGEEMKQRSCGDQEHCRMVIGERKLPAELAMTKGSQLSSHPQKKEKKSTALLICTDEA